MILAPGVSLQAVLAGAISASEPEVNVYYRDWNTEGIPTSPQMPARVALNGAADVTILAAPMNPAREVLGASIFNKDSASVTVTVKTDNGTTEFIIVSAVLATLESLHWQQGRGWYSLDANGALK